MQEKGEEFGEQDEDTEIQNLPLYTERKADGIYRYRRRVPKSGPRVAQSNTDEAMISNWRNRPKAATRKTC